MSSRPAPSVATLLLPLALACCSQKSPTQARPSVAAARSTVVCEPAGATVRIAVEVVSSSKDRARGLMFRKELPASAGMLFIFDREENHPFWMKNTYIPLDLIFLGEHSRVVGIVENAEPLSTKPLTIPAPSRYVVEVNGGFAKRHAIGIDTPCVLPKQARRPVSD